MEGIIVAERTGAFPGGVQRIQQSWGCRVRASLGVPGAHRLGSDSAPTCHGQGLRPSIPATPGCFLARTTENDFSLDIWKQWLPLSLCHAAADVRSVSRCPTLWPPWTVAHQAPLSTEVSRQEYWSVLPFPTPEDLPDPGIEPTSPALAGIFFTTEPPGKPYFCCLSFWLYFSSLLIYWRKYYVLLLKISR